MPRLKYLVIFVLFILLVVVAASFLGFKLSQINNPFNNSNEERRYEIELRSNYPGYELVKSDKFDDFLKYLNDISFWQGEGVYDFETKTMVKTSKLIIYLDDKPGSSDRVRNSDKGIDISSFYYKVSGNTVSVYLYTNVDGIGELNLDKEDVFNQALMRAVYFIIRKDSAAHFTFYLDEVSGKIKSVYKEPYVNIKKKSISKSGIFKKLIPEVKAQSDCERWQCGTPSYDWRCGGDPGGASCTGSGDSSCDPQTCQSTQTSCDPAYWEGDPVACRSPGGDCPGGQCVSNYSCNCSIIATPTPAPGGGGGVNPDVAFMTFYVVRDFVTPGVWSTSRHDWAQGWERCNGYLNLNCVDDYYADDHGNHLIPGPVIIRTEGTNYNHPDRCWSGSRYREECDGDSTQISPDGGPQTIVTGDIKDTYQIWGVTLQPGWEVFDMQSKFGNGGWNSMNNCVGGQSSVQTWGYRCYINNRDTRFRILVRPAGPPSCSLSLPATIPLNPGESRDLNTNLTINSGGATVNRFTTTLGLGTADITLCDTATGICGGVVNDTNPYSSRITALTSGNKALTIEGFIDDVPNPGDVTVCSPQALTTITVSNTQAWWQVIGGDVVAGGALGNIQSLLPTLTTPCTTPTCERYLIRDNPLDSPGVPSAGSGTNYGSDGSASSQSWNAEGSAFLVSKVPDYEAFEARIPSGVTPYEITTSSIDGSTFETEVANYFGGYYWYKYTAPGTTFTINAPLDGVIDLNNRRVILFVDSADLTIGSKISATPGLGGIYIIADKDITFDPGTLAAPLVGHPETTADASTPDVYGLFYADGQIFTGSDGALPDDDLQLHVKGSLAGLGMDASGTLGINDGVVFQRKLSDNTDKPGEIIEFAPDLILSWPPYLSDKNITWKEVAP